MQPDMRRKKGGDDPFLRIAITFILGVVVGFALILLGFLFLFVALLASTTETYPTPWWIWFLLGITAEAIGGPMMYFTLKGSPKPGEM